MKRKRRETLITIEIARKYKCDAWIEPNGTLCCLVSQPYSNWVYEHGLGSRTLTNLPREAERKLRQYSKRWKAVEMPNDGHRLEHMLRSLKPDTHDPAQCGGVCAMRNLCRFCDRNKFQDKECTWIPCANPSCSSWVCESCEFWMLEYKKQFFCCRKSCFDRLHATHDQINVCARKYIFTLMRHLLLGEIASVVLLYL